MLTFKDYTENYTCFTFTLLRFKSQNEVVYDTHAKTFRLNKSELIVCIKYILFRLSQLGFLDKVKHGFVLDKFKYFELSVYLHGLCQLYSRLINMSPVGELYIKQFSHLPHDVMKPEKKVREIEVAYIKDMFGGSSYCCVICDKPWSALSLDVLRQQLLDNYEFLRKYHLDFVVK